MATLGPLTATWGADIDSTAKFPNDGADWCGDSDSFRVANKWDISGLPADATVTQVDVSIAVQAAGGAGVNWDLGCYGPNGQNNPETDALATAFARCIPGNVYLSTDAYLSTGVKTHTALGTQANTDVEAARAAGTIFSMAWRRSANARCDFSEYTHGTNPPKLTITYTPAPAGRIMSSLAGSGGLVGRGGIAGPGGGLAG